MMPVSLLTLAALATPVGVASLGAMVARLAQRARERARHTALLAGVGAPLGNGAMASLPPKTVATLEGVVAAASPDVVTFHPYGTSLLDEPNVYAVTHVATEPAFAIDLDGGGRAVVEGALQVVVGSTETEHTTPLERASDLGAETLATATVKKRLGQFRLVRAGDRVRLRGVISPAPDDDASYRERGNTFRIAPLAGGEPGVPSAVILAATSPVSARRMRASRVERAVLAGALGLGIAAALFTGARPPGGGAAGASAASASMASASTTASCRKAVLERLEKNDPEAGRAAHTCSDAYARALASFSEGAFADASTAFIEARSHEPDLAPSLTEVEAHLFVHDFRHAAATAHVMIGRFYQGPETAEKRYLECIAGVLDARAGQPDGGAGPIARNTWMNTTYRKVCSSRDFAAFARELDAEGKYYGAEDMKAWQQQTYAAAAAYDVVGTPVTAPLATRARLAARPIALEKHLVDRLLLTPVAVDATARPDDSGFGRLAVFDFVSQPGTEYARMSGFAADVALFHAFSGLPERNARYWPILDRVAQSLESGTSFFQVKYHQEYEKKRVEEEQTLLSYVMSLGASAALASGDNARAERYAKVGEVHSARIIRQLATALLPGAAWETPPEDGNWPDHKAVFEAALTGDGRNVVQVLVTQRATGSDTLPRTLPLVRSNRTVLDTWFAGSFPAPCLTCGASTLHGHLADRREVARLLGGAALRERERLLPAVKRFTDALTDPEIAFELDEVETFFAARR